MISDEGYDLLGVGDMGIGNTTPSSAIIAALSGEPVTATTGCCMDMAAAYLLLGSPDDRPGSSSAS